MYLHMYIIEHHRMMQPCLYKHACVHVLVTMYMYNVHDYYHNNNMTVVIQVGISFSTMV